MNQHPETRLSLSPNALRVLESRYLRRDSERRVVETPAEMFERVAAAVALAEGRDAALWRDRFLQAMLSLEFLPNSPTLMNAGTPLGQLAACFVLPVEDSLEEIFDAVKQMVMIQRTGGGTGFSFSRLRPKGDVVASTGGASSGPVSFIKVFDSVTEHIKQGGRRRGANMGVLRVEHPDVLDFIKSKQGTGALKNFNISVGASDAFMNAVESGGDLELVHPRTGRSAGSLKARTVFDAIVEAAWETGDPGMVFLDTIARVNPVPHLGAIEATNPCGEVPLLPYEACILASINLSRMLSGDTIAWEHLRATARLGVRFLDDVIEVNRYPLEEIDRTTKGNRKIGLGVMGLADVFIRLGIPYDSDAAEDLGGRIMREVASAAREASEALAAERGVFPNWRGSVHEREGKKVRNACQTAIAPTGTISIIAGTSPSIEPLFALAYRRTHVLEDETLAEMNPLFQAELEREGVDARRLFEDVLRAGDLREVDGVPERLRRLFVTALEIAPERHLRMQAAFQRHVDNSVSKTINLPEEATLEDVRDAYWTAWRLGLKGITVFRRRTGHGQVLELGVGEEPLQAEHATRCDPGECEL